MLEARGPGWARVRVGGVTFHLFLPASSLEKLGPLGKEVSLHTHLYQREDNMALYGFTTEEELALFQSCLGVTGIGPKLALALLSALPPQRLAVAIEAGDTDLLTQVPGVGKKTAQRLVLELKGRLEIAAAPAAEGDGQVISALTNLGYSLAEASRAVSSLPQGKKLSLEDKIKMALQNLGAR